MKYTDLIDAPGKKEFIYRWIGYRVRYFGCWIGVIGANILRRGRIEVTIDLGNDWFDKAIERYYSDKEY